MKKDTFYTGIGFIVFGLILSGAGVWLKKENSMLGTMGIAFLSPGILMVVRCWYWSRPDKKEIYEERVKQERIESSDERNVILRARAGQGMYMITIVLLSLGILISSLVHMDKWFIILLSAFGMAELAGYWIIYHILERKI